MTHAARGEIGVSSVGFVPVDIRESPARQAGVAQPFGPAPRRKPEFHDVHLNPSFGRERIGPPDLEGRRSTGVA